MRPPHSLHLVEADQMVRDELVENLLDALLDWRLEAGGRPNPLMPFCSACQLGERDRSSLGAIFSSSFSVKNSLCRQLKEHKEDSGERTHRLVKEVENCCLSATRGDLGAYAACASLLC